jgi:hypothetical protein
MPSAAKLHQRESTCSVSKAKDVIFLKAFVESDMTAVETIRAKLKRYPQLRYEQTPDSITIFSESNEGFQVSLFQDGSRFVVAFDGWHEHFESESEALNCFVFGLSEECRVRVTSRGSFDYRWTVQYLLNGSWHDDSETGLLLFPFWRRRHERYLQNRVIPTAASR